MLIVASVMTWPHHKAFADAGCNEALAQHSVCEQASKVTRDAMKSRRLEAISVVQDVQTGALVVFAASQPSKLDVSTQVLPLSLAKVFLAASWWDHKMPDPSFDGGHRTGDAGNPALQKRVDVHEMLVGGSDSAGRQAAIVLRKAVGTQVVLGDLHRYGFNTGGEPFWAQVDRGWKKRLTPQPASAALAALDDQEWGSALSIGESYMTATALQVSRFFQAIGNDGLLCEPVALRLTGSSTREREPLCVAPSRMVEDATAKQLIDALLDTVQRGSASRISGALKDTGWAIGGKTGTGGQPGLPMDQQDGWFAGLIFDGQGKARFTVATFVRKGGLGGGHAAMISAELARFLASDDPR